MNIVGEFTVKTQESEMQSNEEKFTEEFFLQFQVIFYNFFLQFHQQKSASTLSMEFVGRSAYILETPVIIL